MQKEMKLEIKLDLSIIIYKFLWRWNQTVKKEYMKIYREENKEKIKLRKQKWYFANKEKIEK